MVHVDIQIVHTLLQTAVDIQTMWTQTVWQKLKGIVQQSKLWALVFLVFEPVPTGLLIVLKKANYSDEDEVIRSA